MTNLKNSYFRNFLIFEKEDTGYGDGMEPSGYVKLEGRDGKGKLLATVQNLKEGAGKIQYRLYLIQCTSRSVKTVQVGSIPIQKGRGELKWEFDIDSVAESGISINDFNVAAIVAEDKDRDNKVIICPLAAYKGDKVSWRDKVLSKRQENGLDGEEYQKKMTVPRPLTFPEYSDIQNNITFPKYSGLKEAEFDEEIIQKQNAFDFSESSLKDENEYHENASDSDIIEKTVDNNLDEPAQENGDLNFAENSENEEQHENSQISNNEIYSNAEPENCFCPQGPQTVGVNPCVNCYVKSYQNPLASQDPQYAQNRDTGEDIERMIKSFDKYFSVFDPFNSKRRDYKWWKVDNPVNLNNILYQCHIRSPLLFNPSVMMAHFKFKHLSIGLYTDKIKKREYLVCGIPGVFGIDAKPFGDMCKWIQLEGNVHKYGAFGYWIVYIDPKTGKFLHA